MQFSNFNDITKLTNKFLLGEKKAYAVKLYANFYSKEIFLRIEMLKCNHGVLLFKMDSLKSGPFRLNTAKSKSQTR